MRHILLHYIDCLVVAGGGRVFFSVVTGKELLFL